ncbi:MAG: T9SS type A sorting domain-containing protein [Cyclobacteriaceae bacterium]|nr:T9SS type A sorting domain-containing protein [Cyclobacteriaceae bacterium HetDA_MAG_MS6]
MKTHFLILLAFFFYSTRSGFTQVIYDPLADPVDGSGTYNEFGYTVATNANGTVIAVGSHREDGNGFSDSGAIRIYQWDQVAGGYVLESHIPGDVQYDLLGYALSMNDAGDRIIAGAPSNGSMEGRAVVFSRDEMGSWNQMGQPITLPVNTGSRTGYSVDMSADGDVIAVSAPLYNQDLGWWVFEDVGMAGAFSWDAASLDWALMPNGQKTGYMQSEFGTGLALTKNGRYMAVGFPDAIGGNDIEEGGVHIYDLDNGASYQGAVLGSELPIAKVPYGFGTAVDIALTADGTLKLVTLANTYHDAFVHRYDPNSIPSWNLEARIGYGIPCYAADKGFQAISFSGDASRLALGNGLCEGSGRTHVYDFNDLTNDWDILEVQTGLNTYDGFGYAVTCSTDGDHIVTGSPNYFGYVDDGDYVYIRNLSPLVDIKPPFKTKSISSFYPNPAADFVNISKRDGKSIRKVLITNSLGEVVLSATDPERISINHLENGLYQMQLYTAESAEPEVSNLLIRH